MILLVIELLLPHLLLWQWLGEKPLPPSTPEIRKLVDELGDPEYNKREWAQKKLIDLEIKSMRDCLRAANTSDDPEIRKRAGEIVGKYYGVRSDDKKTPMPSIYMLPDKIRFPHGVKIEMDEEMNGAGWCKTMESPFDLAAFYFEKARENFNSFLTENQKYYGHGVNGWLDDFCEREAMRLFTYDMLKAGRSRKEVKDIVNEAAERTQTHKNSYRHYNGGSCTDVVPGPAIPSASIPEGAERRYGGYYYRHPPN